MYLFSYFRTESEALHLALSEDGFAFEAVNGNKPILEASADTRTMRDPFLIQTEDGAFQLLATDGWGGASIMHATSADLITWSDQRVIPVMENVEGTRNCWAPEAFYAREEKTYLLIWSSTVSDSPEQKVRDHRIWCCETTDFSAFSEPRLFFDPGYNVIDATVAPYGDAYLMAFKDERGVNKAGTDFKAIRTAMSLKAGGPYEAVSDLVTPSLVEGPTLYQKDGLWVMLYDHFVDHRYGASLSEDGRSWDVSEVEIILPEGPRHGSIIEIDDQVAYRLRSHFA